MRAAGQASAADELGRRLVAQDPACGPAWHELAQSAVAAGQLDLAEQLLDRGCRHAPDAELRHALGLLLLRRARPAEAVHALRKAVEAAPGWAGAIANLGLALHRSGRLAEATACYRRALALDAGLVHTRSNLASLLKDGGDLADAQAQFEQALAQAPDEPWLISNVLWASCHDAGLPAAALYDRHRELGRRLASVAPFRFQPPPAPRDGSRLKLGFVSADLRRHAVAFFLLPVLQGLDRQRFSVHAYACNEAADDMTQALRGACDGWTEAFRLDDDALAGQVRADGIDLLVDLAGHTSGNRLPVFARRAAPVQATWIGYPCTTGVPGMDYLLSDSVLAPPGLADQAFIERIVRMPGAVGFEVGTGLPDVGPLPAQERGRLTFGSFHRPSKLTEATLRCWARILAGLPTARLLVAHCNDEATRAELLERLGRQGVAAGRLDFQPRLPFPHYMALHRQVDLVLDAVGFSGGTTTLHALSMGVPVLAIAGESMPARQSAAILVHAGLGAFVADTPEGLAAIATGWSRRLDDLAAIRAGLRDRLSRQLRMRDAPRAFEAAVQAMWNRWAAGLPPAALAVDGDGVAAQLGREAVG